MKIFGRIVFDRNLIFAGALALGLAAPGAAGPMLVLLFPVLGLVILISSLSIGPEAFRRPTSALGGALAGVAANYLLMTAVIIAVARLMISDVELRTGFILVAAIPPAVAVIPFAEMLGGNRTLSLFGTVGGLVSAFALMPLVSFTFIGSERLDPGRLLLILTGLIIVPFAVSRLIRAVGLSDAVGPYKGPATNICFGIAFYIMVAANQDSIVRHTGALVLPIAVGILITVVSGGIVLAVCRLFSIDRQTVISLVLLATLKNYAISAGFALALFSERTALPSVIMTIIMIPYIIILDFLYGPRKKEEGAVLKK